MGKRFELKTGGGETAFPCVLYIYTSTTGFRGFNPLQLILCNWTLGRIIKSFTQSYQRHQFCDSAILVIQFSYFSIYHFILWLK